MVAGLSSNLFPGTSVGVWQLGKGERFWSVGNLKKDSSPNVNEHTIYDVASVTKAIPLALLVNQLITTKQISLTDKVSDFLPATEKSEVGEITILDLLTYRPFFGVNFSSFKNISADEIWRKLFLAKVTWQKGETVLTNPCAILLTLILNQVTGLEVDQLAEDKIFKPLGLNDTSFVPTSLENVAPSEIDVERGGEIIGVVHDESAWALRPKKLGSAGLFSSTFDLLQVMKSVVELSDSVEMQSMTILNNRYPQTKMGLGWEVDRAWMGKNSSSGFGKTGFTGCFVYGDLQKKLAVVMLSNSTFPTRSNDRKSMNEFRSKLLSAVYTELKP